MFKRLSIIDAQLTWEHSSLCILKLAVSVVISAVINSRHYTRRHGSGKAKQPPMRMSITAKLSHEESGTTDALSYAEAPSRHETTGKFSGCVVRAQNSQALVIPDSMPPFSSPHSKSLYLCSSPPLMRSARPPQAYTPYVGRFSERRRHAWHPYPSHCDRLARSFGQWGLKVPFSSQATPSINITPSNSKRRQF
jgi:hypothetical protein